MAGRRAPLLLCLLLLAAVRPDSLEEDIPTASEVSAAGADGAEPSAASEWSPISISAIDLDSLELDDDRADADQQPLLFRLWRSSNSEASFRAFLEHLKKSDSVDVNVAQGSDESEENPPCANDTSACNFRETMKHKITLTSGTLVKPLSPFTICAIVVSVLIIVVAAVWYTGKRYVLHYWNMMQLMLHWETTEVVERRDNIRGMVYRPTNVPS